jgi:hypothetical protein
LNDIFVNELKKSVPRAEYLELYNIIHWTPSELSRIGGNSNLKPSRPEAGMAAKSTACKHPYYPFINI